MLSDVAAAIQTSPCSGWTIAISEEQSAVATSTRHNCSLLARRRVERLQFPVFVVIVAYVDATLGGGEYETAAIVGYGKTMNVLAGQSLLGFMPVQATIGRAPHTVELDA